jgi:hypothetical protein
MNQGKLGLVAIATLLLVLALGVWWRGHSSGKAKPFTHMHCPACFLEIIYDAAKVGQNCPHCGPSGPKWIATVGTAADREVGDSPIANIVVALFVAAAFGLVATYAWLLRVQMLRKADDDAKKKPLICHCPFCERKIGYLVNKVGATAVCPRCKTAFTLPEGVPVEES